MATKLFVNLPVKDLNRSKAFFTELGLAFFGQAEDMASVIISEHTQVMLLTESVFASYARRGVVDVRHGPPRRTPRRVVPDGPPVCRRRPDVAFSTAPVRVLGAGSSFAASTNRCRLSAARTARGRRAGRQICSACRVHPRRTAPRIRWAAGCARRRLGESLVAAQRDCGDGTRRRSRGVP